ncbi:hypothetical protein KXX35_004533 [Aspergillus fumigatus]|nr:hypothetical protein KXX35_004533 [Aspergillus fumigatus]
MATKYATIASTFGVAAGAFALFFFGPVCATTSCARFPSLTSTSTAASLPRTTRSKRLATSAPFSLTRNATCMVGHLLALPA